VIPRIEVSSAGIAFRELDVDLNPDSVYLIYLIDSLVSAELAE
jgi:hypothetical protein